MEDLIQAKRIVMSRLCAGRDALKATNNSPEAHAALDKTHSFIEEYIEALFSPHFPDVKIPLFPTKVR